MRIITCQCHDAVRSALRVFERTDWEVSTERLFPKRHQAPARVTWPNGDDDDVSIVALEVVRCFRSFCRDHWDLILVHVLDNGQRRRIHADDLYSIEWT